MTSKPQYWRVSGQGLDPFREKRPDDQVDAMVRRHVIAEVCYRLEEIDCTCGEVVTAGEDLIVHDRHEPLVAAWEKHKRDAALARGRRHAA